MSEQERSDWRDEQLIRRHHKWGLSCPALDLGFVAIEYDDGHPCAIIEYRSHDSKPVDLSHPTYRALLWIANKCDLPFLTAWYNPNEWWFIVQPHNDHALKFYSELGSRFSERSFVQSLYSLRGRTLERDFIPLNGADIRSIDELSSHLPPEDVTKIICPTVIYEQDSWPIRQDISRRHREWGKNCPAVDLDYILIDFNHGLPIAIFEYRHTPKRPSNDTNTNATLELAQKCRLPYLGVQYSSEDWWFLVSGFPIQSNGEEATRPGKARIVIDKRCTELGWAKYLHELRDHAVAQNDKLVLTGLSTVEPPKEFI